MVGKLFPVKMSDFIVKVKEMRDTRRYPGIKVSVTLPSTPWRKR